MSYREKRIAMICHYTVIQYERSRNNEPELAPYTRVKEGKEKITDRIAPICLTDFLLYSLSAEQFLHVLGDLLVRGLGVAEDFTVGDIAAQTTGVVDAVFFGYEVENGGTEAF